MRRAISTCVLVISILFPIATQAATVEDLLKQIEGLLAQLQVLRTQVVDLQISNAENVVLETGPTTCFKGNRSLARGSSGEDVRQLQVFLSQTNDFTHPEFTNYFGAITEAAVQSWQARNGVVLSGTPEATGFGVVGPRTRVAMSDTCGTAVVSKQFCTIGPVVMAHGTSREFYSKENLSSNESCDAYVETRMCDDGNLSGNASYQFAFCTDEASRSCTAGDVIIPNGVSTTFYSKESVSQLSSCEQYAQTRMCDEGLLSGDAPYIYASCSALNEDAQAEQELNALLSSLLPPQPPPVEAVTSILSDFSTAPVQTYVPTNTTQTFASCIYKGVIYPEGMKTEGTSRNDLCLGADITNCAVQVTILPQFVCRNGIWERSSSNAYDLPVNTGYQGSCTPTDKGCHFCIVGNYGVWTTASCQ